MSLAKASVSAMAMLFERVRAVTFGELDLLRYEGERPSEALACRSGDERFFPSLQTA